MAKFFTKEAEENFMRMCLHFFENEFALDPTQVSLLILDSPGYSRDYRNKLAEIFFEGLKIHSIDFMNTGVTSIFSSGRTEGLSIEVGHGSHSSVPVYSGYPLYHASHCTHLAGQDIYEYVSKCLESNLPSFDRFDCDRSIILKEIKERKATCSLDYERAVITHLITLPFYRER